TSDWVLACDGAHSLVRDKLGIAFEGEDFQEQFMMADIPIDSELSRNEGHAFFSEEGPLVFISMRDFTRVIVDISQLPELQKKAELVWEDFLPVIRRRCPIEFVFYDAKWISKFYIHRKLAKTYQKGRCFLLGDAAHIHSPVGGQGMNTGIQDAFNLAF